MKPADIKRNEILKEISSLAKQAAAEIRAAREGLVVSPAVPDLDAIKQAYLAQIAAADAELAELATSP